MLDTLQAQLVYDDKSRVRGSFRSIGHHTTISFSVKFKRFLKLQNEDGQKYLFRGQKYPYNQTVFHCEGKFGDSQFLAWVDGY